MYYRLLFFKVRLGVKASVVDIKYKTEEKDYSFVYRPLDNIMYLLNHEDAYIDALKIDVEGSEWNIFVESICKVRIAVFFL